MRLSLLLLLLALPLAACGGGGGGPAYDLNGWWLLAATDPADGRPLIAYPGPASHRGSSFVHLGVRLTVDGDRVFGAEPDYETPSRTEYDLTLVSADRMQGEIRVYAFGAPNGVMDAQLIRTPPPQGTFTVDGNPGGLPVSLASTTSFAYVESTPAAGGGTDLDVQIRHMRPEGGDALRIAYWQPDVWLPPRTLAVPADAHATLVLDYDAYGATAGSVTITRYDANRIEGEYTLVLGLEGTAHGTFAVPVIEDLE